MSPGLGLTFPGQRTASRGPRVSIFERCGHRGPNNTRGQNNTRFQRPVEKAFSCSAPKMPRSGRSGQLRVTYQQKRLINSWPVCSFFFPVLPPRVERSVAGHCDEGPNFRVSMVHSSNRAFEREVMNEVPAMCEKQKMADPNRTV